MIREYVLDASVLAAVLSSKTEDAAQLRDRLTNSRHHAPHLIDAELGNVVRRLVRNQTLTATEGHTAIRGARTVITHRYPHAGALLELAWELRDNLSFYDALYVALSARLNLPLLTKDTRLANSPGLPCTVELI